MSSPTRPGDSLLSCATGGQGECQITRLTHAPRPSSPLLSDLFYRDVVLWDHGYSPDGRERVRSCRVARSLHPAAKQGLQARGPAVVPTPAGDFGTPAQQE